MIKKVASILFLFGYVVAHGQDTTDYYNPSFLRYENHVYIPTIHTVTLENAAIALSEPVLQLGTEDKLMLTFDDLADDSRDFGYRIIHCDMNWQPSVLSESDYIDGFYTDHIIEYKHSFNTLIPYWHYSLEFPNAQMKPLISGNYLMVVFDNSNPDQVLITRRFWVTENKIQINPRIHRATDISLMNSDQEIDFSLNISNLKIPNPFGDVKVVIVQNNRWDHVISNLKPMMVQDDELRYDYEDENLFEGGNEFRSFDTRSTRFLTQFTDSIQLEGSTGPYDFILKPETFRSSLRYSSIDDIDGKYLVKIYEGRDSQLEADYVKVNFRLKTTTPIAEKGDLYLFGQLTDWGLPGWSKMHYSAEEKSYLLSLTLKQGYYNYMYVFLPDQGKGGTLLETEGSHYETENKYCFYVYFKTAGDRYDHLIGFRQVGSRE